MRSFLLRRAAWVYLDGPGGARGLVEGVDVLVIDGVVAAVGERVPAPSLVREIEASDWLVLPGFVNAHHHLSQQLTRTRASDGDLVDWLIALYPVWAVMDEELAFHAARVGIAELLLTGTTTISDFTYFYPRGRERMFDAQVEAARGLGCRFVPVRGGISELEAGVRDAIGHSLDDAMETRDTLLAELTRAVDSFHDPSPNSFCRVAVGLTEKAYRDPALMRELATFAERRDLRLHTHFHPRPDERRYTQDNLGVEPIDFLEDVGWCGERLWVAHGTELGNSDVARLVKAGVGLCTCPSSNARFGARIAPAFAFHTAGGNVAIGVDGAASNDSGDFLGECRLALQVQRIGTAAAGGAFRAVTPRVVIDWATAGGGGVLGWPELGRLSVGLQADIACFDLGTLEFVGADDPLAALLLCGTSHRATLVAVGGSIVVENGRLTHVDEETLTREAGSADRELRRRVEETTGRR